ncbi:diphthine--ammonia ligase [Pontibacter ummariensis]|uniref:Dph6-related ATP pyrophosphatase n=1 Tax=Pontibacter ummariensis TaxID=1610492 RepID=UPI000B78B999|nr:diphthine--ammonia ligase [Pontibacter ummariensis]
MIPSIFNWSGGKDSTLCLHHLLKEKKYQVHSLLTTLGGATGRVSMHGVRQELLKQQAFSLGLPLQEVMLPEQASMSAYNEAMEQALQPLKQAGIAHAVFGDINLEDLRMYREQQLQQVSMQAVFPLWGRDTLELAQEFISLGYRAVVVCVNERLLDSSFVGRHFDEAFLQDLPSTVDPAGENGEFHTFVFDGPLFKAPVHYTLGEKVRKTYGMPAKEKDDNCFKKEDKPAFDTGFWFCDLLPA